ncbi:MAG: sodium:solute symporter [Bryobacteraceae bacterium]
MRPLDWIVLAGALAAMIAYGLYKGRGSNTVDKYLLAGKTMPWYAMALSIMATQASAITFLTTTGQGYADGMRFVQMYFGLPIAMVIVAATAVPIFHRANVYTAYEYLEQRFDSKTRALVSAIFMIQRGLAVGLSLAAPAIVLTAILGWPYRATTVLIAGLVMLYTVTGGVRALTWTDVQQMGVIFCGLLAALATAVWLLPSHLSFFDAVSLAGAAGKLNAVDLHFDLKNRYNIWSGLIGGTFLALAYFGTDQSQVQRYLSGKSIAQSRLSLLFNALAKIPMQFVILFTGAMVFVFYLYQQPPLLFQPAELQRIAARNEYRPVASQYNRAFDERKLAADGILEARRSSDAAVKRESLERYRRAERDLDQARERGIQLARETSGDRNFSDTNYIFLSFVTRYMPAGIVGLILAVIFAATMSSIAAEFNSLATVSVIDIYRRHIRRRASDRHYLWASRAATAFWGCYAMIFAARYGQNLGTLVEAVNVVGSLFYGGMLGVFVLAFGFPRVRGTAAFTGVLAGEAAIFYASFCTGISFLWYNVLGCCVVVAVGLLLSMRQAR